MARRSLREARLAGSLGHPNTVTVYNYLDEGVATAARRPEGVKRAVSALPQCGVSHPASSAVGVRYMFRATSPRGPAWTPHHERCAQPPPVAGRPRRGDLGFAARAPRHANRDGTAVPVGHFLAGEPTGTAAAYLVCRHRLRNVAARRLRSVSAVTDAAAWRTGLVSVFAGIASSP